MAGISIRRARKTGAQPGIIAKQSHNRPPDLVSRALRCLEYLALALSLDDLIGAAKQSPAYSLRYISWKQRKEVAANLKEIYQATTAEHAELNLTDFAQKWDESHPAISQSWHRNWERIIPFFSYPAEIRKVIYTTNAIESLNMSQRKVTKNRGSFTNDEAMFKLL